MCELEEYKYANPDMFICGKECPSPICPICKYGRCCLVCDKTIVLPMREKALRNKVDKAVEREKVIQMIAEKWSSKK